MVSKFGERFSATDSNADGYSGPLPDPLADLYPILDQIPIEPGQVQKRFIDGIDFLLGSKLANHGVHPLAHVGVQGVIATFGDDAVLFSQVPELEPGSPHWHS